METKDSPPKDAGGAAIPRQVSQTKDWSAKADIMLDGFSDLVVELLLDGQLIQECQTERVQSEPKEGISWH